MPTWRRTGGHLAAHAATSSLSGSRVLVSIGGWTVHPLYLQGGELILFLTLTTNEKTTPRPQDKTKTHKNDNSCRQRVRRPSKPARPFQNSNSQQGDLGETQRVPPHFGPGANLHLRAIKGRTRRSLRALTRSAKPQLPRTGLCA